MAPKKPSSSPSPISIGNCKVQIDGRDCVCEQIDGGLLISVPNRAKIKISRDKGIPLEDYSYVLVDPKDGDSDTKALLEEILKIYSKQLPAMNYAANTGKESHFLEKCISSGKYRTMILKSNCMGKVIAAVSYQIIAADTHYAEVPLAAVCSNYQNKGFGHLLYTEVKERLQSVGTSTILCWADKVSEGFWLKQGFIAIGEVDSKGKARKLPIKADIKRALCFPGGSTLMISHLNKNNMDKVKSSEHVKICSFAKSHAKSDIPLPCKSAEHMETRENSSSFSLSEDVCLTGSCHKAHGMSPSGMQVPHNGNTDPCSNRNGNMVGVNPVVTESGKTNQYNGSTSQRVKRCAWEASLSSLKSKRVKGSHGIDDCWNNQDFGSQHVRESDAALNDCSLDTSDTGNVQPITEGRLSGHRNGIGPKVMFMNIANDYKKTCLTKIVEELGGSVTCTGSSCTHVITGKARKTLNFCIALCSGAWIVTSNWLKASCREGQFIGESPFILQDEDYLLKYKLELKDAVNRAKLKPHSLFRGYNVCVAKHIEPSMVELSAIIKAAGGNVIRSLAGIKEPSKTIFLACEEDMEDAMVAAKKGVWTFSSDWFMTCVMKQELDMEAPQFAESL